MNKVRPWMHCNGRCYLAKKIKQAEDNEKKQAARNLESQIDLSWFQNPLRFVFMAPEINVHHDRLLPVYVYHYRNITLSGVYRPPKPVV